MSKTVGFAGLGNLGLPMALALVDAGWSVTGYDPRASQVDALVAGGGVAASGVGDLASSVLALAVPDDDAVRTLLLDEDLLASVPDGGVVVVHSTVLPATARSLGELAASRGVAFVDAPVSGGFERARAGSLTVMAGASAGSLELAQGYLDDVASDVVHVGAPGSGAAAKLANQLMMFAALAGTHEALSLAASYDVSVENVLTVASTSTGSSWVSQHWGFFDEVAAAYDAAGTAVPFRPWSKDLWEIVAAARSADVSVPLAGLLAQTLAETVERHAHR
ncbi:NAD(P)-dependent oxidoreductase [Tenggerimyces flavus]|uniref:NAD(P)-dependent oxidoreductase n=1 Tax=Tenggerimyces flavus TaxID=1708749 RepID=A0ABV7Y1Z2_9ACTN|nr:NAD(P)-binding domain-containing protein [Tenggerimyces flavus]MBM7790876.1 3-hydroxyisobutyrate dehydrogenase [Tenggerimyces flavus]